MGSAERVNRRLVGWLGARGRQSGRTHAFPAVGGGSRSCLKRRPSCSPPSPAARLVRSVGPVSGPSRSRHGPMGRRWWRRGRSSGGSRWSGAAAGSVMTRSSSPTRAVAPPSPRCPPPTGTPSRAVAEPSAPWPPTYADSAPGRVPGHPCHAQLLRGIEPVPRFSIGQVGPDIDLKQEEV